MINSVMFECKDYSVDLMNDKDYAMESINGISASADINTHKTSGYDSEEYISSNMSKRNIILSVIFLADDAEPSKFRLYDCFPVKGQGVLYYKTNTKDVKINCVVESIEIPPNAYPMKAAISLVCPDPYFVDVNENACVMSNLTAMFRFPHLFNGPFMFGKRSESVIENCFNKSTAYCYPVFTFEARTALANPSIMNINTYEYMKINRTMVAGEKIVIDTHVDHKTIILNGTESIFNQMDEGSLFFYLSPGNNYLKYDADENPSALKTTIKWETLYGGV